jgi:EAL and modified HD-GYP domain-containing signal transduction protein
MLPTTSNPAPSQSVDLFAARQPIFDVDRNVVAYELLFRAGPENVFPAQTNPDDASARVIVNALSVFGLDALVADRPAFVNVTRRILLESTYACFPPSRLVIELLETLRPDSETLRACQQARAEGYTLALDDFTGQPELLGFLPYVDVLKVDWRACDAERRASIAASHGRDVVLLAEKVENEAEFAAAKALGFTRFQGFFFCRPEMVARRDIPSNKLAHLQFLRELARPSLDYVGLEKVIKLDVSLSVKLLRYLNTAGFGFRREVSSIQQALTMLGERPFRRWSSLLVLSVMSKGSPAELLHSCQVRARFCELLAPESNLVGRELDLFLLGLLSLVDALVGRPLDELVLDLGLPPDIAGALTGAGSGSPMREALTLVSAYERADWTAVDAAASRLQVRDRLVLTRLYQEALQWAAASGV